MTKEKGPKDPSMEEILSSIRQLIASEAEPPLTSSEKNEDILDLTELLPDEANSSKKHKPHKHSPAGKKSMGLPAWAKNIKTPIPTETRKGGDKKDEALLSRVAAAEAAEALKNFAQFAQKSQNLSGKPADTLEPNPIEQQLRVILKPLLKEWLDANLPLLVRWLVNEQIEKLIHQYGLDPSSLKAKEGTK